MFEAVGVPGGGGDGELIDAVRAALGGAASGAADAELFERAQTCEQLRTAIDAAEADVLAELRGRRACDLTFGMRTAPWLAHHAMLPPAVAKLRVTVADKLRRVLPLVAAALAAGEIGWEHARVLCELAHPRIEDKVVAEQEMLLKLAHGCRFDMWRRHVRALGQLWDQDGGHDPADDDASNKLSMAETLDGLLHLAATLTGERAEAVRQGIEAKADELYRRAVADQQVTTDLELPSRATLRAFALEELVRQALGVDVDSSRPPRPEVALIITADADSDRSHDDADADSDRSHDDADADADADADSEPADALTADSSSETGRERPGRRRGAPRRFSRLSNVTGAFNPDGIRLPDSAVRTFLCDCDVYAVVVDSLGVPVDLGRRVRWANENQRRAAHVRDGGCIFPGCTAPSRWVELHHWYYWRFGGRTDLVNLVSLCRHHHRVLHRRGWQLLMSEDGWFWFRTPTGQTFWAQRHGRQHEGAVPEVPRHQANGRDPSYDGEPHTPHRHRPERRASRRRRAPVQSGHGAGPNGRDMDADAAELRT